ncbi:MAG: nucleoside deaminase, partial [Proteobacteria bacterium]|nr:nucleoside deaminase [Pseudomonadota bacterium]
MTQPGWNQADTEHMQRALELARRAAAQGEVPVGAVLVGPAGEVIAQAGNATITQGDP